MKKLLIDSFWLSILALSVVVICGLIAAMLLNAPLPVKPIPLIAALWVTSFIGCFIGGLMCVWRYEWRKEDEEMERRKTGLPNDGDWD